MRKNTMIRWVLVPLATIAAAGCASPYTGPIEVNRFVADNQADWRANTITVVIDSDERVAGQAAYEDAVRDELARQGYGVEPAGVPAHKAWIRVEQSALQSGGSRGPVSVGVGGSTGSYGSGLGLGVGINLGGEKKPRFVTELAVRITDYEGGTTLWEGRAEMVTSTDSAFAIPGQNARALAAALFRDFPGGNGETLTVNVSELQGTQ